MWLTPIAAERASYSAPLTFLVILVVVVATYLLLHARPGAVRRALWDCGFEKVTERMQYTATSFSMPLRRIFGFLFFSIEEQVRQLPPAAIRPSPNDCIIISACGTGSGAGSTSP